MRAALRLMSGRRPEGGATGDSDGADAAKPPVPRCFYSFNKVVTGMSKQRPLSATVRARQQQTRKTLWHFPLTKTNFLYFGVALGVILLGFALMATGISSPEETTTEKWGSPLAIGVAPALLVIGFCVLVPFAIMKRDRSTETTDTAS